MITISIFYINKRFRETKGFWFFDLKHFLICGILILKNSNIKNLLKKYELNIRILIFSS